MMLYKDYIITFFWGKNLVKWTIHFLLSSKKTSCKVIEVSAVFNTNLYLAPFDESLSNLIIYKNWILIFIYYKSAWNYVTQLDHFSSELFKIYLIGEEKTPFIVFPSRGWFHVLVRKRSLDAQYIDKIVIF